jgi:hypothetical protein
VEHRESCLLGEAAFDSVAEVHDTLDLGSEGLRHARVTVPEPNTPDTGLEVDDTATGSVEESRSHTANDVETAVHVARAVQQMVQVTLLFFREEKRYMVEDVKCHPSVAESLARLRHIEGDFASRGMRPAFR